MEDTLRAAQQAAEALASACLNPYYNGRYSPSHVVSNAQDSVYGVLILIIMEDTLRVMLFLHERWHNYLS